MIVIGADIEAAGGLARPAAVIARRTGWGGGRRPDRAREWPGAPAGSGAPGGFRYHERGNEDARAHAGETGDATTRARTRRPARPARSHQAIPGRAVRGE